MANNSRENLKCAAKPNNEEIIDEVMKGVESCLLQKSDEEITKSESEIAASSSFKDSKKQSSFSEAKDNEHVGLESTDTNGEDGTSCNEHDDDDDDDNDNELGLKDAEELLSDLEKEERRLEAESHKSTGNNLFKSGSYQESIKSYTLGLRICPLKFSKDRSILYSNRAAAKMKLDLKPSAIEDCTKAVELDPLYLKARYRRAQLYEETDKLDEALADYQEILKLDPLHREALYATKRLPEKINERNEKMKADMMAKLKDLGNMILRPFNLSTDNFQVNQDPNTGGYSINFQPNSSQ